MAELAHVTDLRRHDDMTAVLAAVASGQGRQLMDSIRAEVRGFVEIEQGVLAQQEAAVQSNMRQLLAVIITASLLTLLLALSFAYLIFRETRHRLKNAVHLETQHLLEIQAETNNQLRQANATLQVSEEKLAVTLNSIGDAVIATDAAGHVTILNPLAERLTGWTQAEAADRLVDEIFHIINQETRQPSTIPVKETLAKGTIQGLANHTVLIARDGSERTMKPRHIIVATGVSGIPVWPNVPGLDSFKGTVLHSGQYTSGADWKGRLPLLLRTGAWDEHAQWEAYRGWAAARLPDPKEIERRMAHFQDRCRVEAARKTAAVAPVDVGALVRDVRSLNRSELRKTQERIDAEMKKLDERLKQAAELKDRARALRILAEDARRD
jgi:PAS domain S-box-containing protein